MSESGWTDGAEPPADGPTPDPLSPITTAHPGHNAAAGQGPHLGTKEKDEENAEAEAGVEGEGEDVPAQGWLFRHSRETRFGAVMLLSFLVLAGALIFNKSRTKTHADDKLASTPAGKVPPVNRIAPPLETSEVKPPIAEKPPVNTVAALPDTPPAPPAAVARVTTPVAPPATTPAPPTPPPSGTDPLADSHKGEPVTRTVALNEMDANVLPEPEPVPLPENPKDHPKPQAGDGLRTPPTPVPLPTSDHKDQEKGKPGNLPSPPAPVPPIAAPRPEPPLPGPAPRPIQPPSPTPIEPPIAPLELPLPTPVPGGPTIPPSHGPNPIGSATTPIPLPATKDPAKDRGPAAPAAPKTTPPDPKPSTPAPAPKPEPKPPAPVSVVTPAPAPAPKPEPKPPTPVSAPAPVPRPEPKPPAPVPATRPEPKPPAPTPVVTPTPKQDPKPPAPVSVVTPAPAPAPKPEPPTPAPVPKPEPPLPLAAPAGPPPAAPVRAPEPEKPKPVEPKVESLPGLSPPLATPSTTSHPVDNLPPFAPANDVAAPPSRVPMPAPKPASEAAAPKPATSGAAVKPVDNKPLFPEESGAGNWVPLPNAGMHRSLANDHGRAVEPAAPRPEPAPEPVRSGVGTVAMAGSGLPLRNASAATPRIASDPGGSAGPGAGAETEIRDRVESDLYVVQRGDNFFTISQLYYGTGRYYKALWAANRQTVPVIDKLVIGTTIRIPPPEALDRRLFEPSRPRVEETSPTSGATTTSRPGKARPVGSVGEVDLTLPTKEPFARRGGELRESGSDEPAVSRPSRPRRPRYKVHPHETLRSIARDTLGDSHRADEILELNADAIDDPNHLLPGQVLELPDDAKIKSSAGRDR